MFRTLPVLAASVVAAFAPAQGLPQAGDAAPKPSSDPRVMLDYAQFDPLVGLPTLPANLRAGANVHLHIVQFHATPTDADRRAVEDLGGAIRGYLPHDCHIVEMRDGAMALYELNAVRWVGPYEPAYRLEPFLLRELLAANGVPTRRYNLVMVDKRADKPALAAEIQAMGGEVVNTHDGGLLFTADLNQAQLLRAAQLDEVLWIDRWSDTEEDMDNARIQGGGNYVESVGGYTGSGVRGHVYEGVEGTHPDFTTPIQQRGPAACSAAASHGHATAGIIFGNGTSNAAVRGMAPDAVGFYTTYVSSTSATCATSPARNTIIGDLVNNDEVMFTTASWGNARTFFYTSVSADADDIVFDHRIPWTQSQSNAGNQDSRPQAWGKNIISVGGVRHYDDSNPANDSWNNSGSTGPAQDTRSKPDLAAYYDSIGTSDRTGSAGYSSGNWTGSFGGTSGATPIIAGHNALAIQMYTDGLFQVDLPVASGTRFQNRPLAQTLKALQIAAANMYTPTASDNRREHVGWGFPSLQNMYDRRDKITIIPEDKPIVQGATHTYDFDVASGESIVKFVMTYVDPAGNPAAAFDRINDLTMRVTSPSGVSYWGNNGLDGAGQANQSTSGGSADTRDTVEVVVIDTPQSGTWTVEITAPTVTQDAHLATAATDATYALVVNGGVVNAGAACAVYLPDPSPTGTTSNFFPWGGYSPTTLDTVYASDNGGSIGGTVYFDVTVANPVWIHSVMVNTNTAVGTPLHIDLYSKSGSHVGSEGTPGAWTARTAGSGSAAGADVASQIDLAQPFRLSAGSYAFAIHATDFNHRYTNGANSYVDANLQIDAGAGSNGLFTGGVFTPRTANVSLKYRPTTATAQNMRYQVLLRSSELGAAGNITDLGFAGSASGSHYNSNLQIRMAHRPAGYTMAANFAANISGSSVVHSSNFYTWNYSDGQWESIGLQQPFAYNGTSDVVVEILARGNVQTAVGGFWRESNRPRVYSAVWDLASPATGSVDTSGARIRVEFGCASANEIGSSCGSLAAGHSGSSALGETFTFEVGGAPPSSVAFIGLAVNNGAPFPLDLTGSGFTNCLALQNSIVTLSKPTSATGEATHDLTIPNNPGLVGFRVYGQWLAIDADEPGSLTFSNGTFLTCGSPL
ncbi:MAG: S8 family serine peptidase [Planctomycetota bacterium]